MTCKNLLFLLGAFVLLGFSDAAEYANDNNDQIIQQVFGLNYEKFDWDIFKRLSSPDVKNVFISPLSLKMALAVLYEAASGTTKQQLEEVLEFPSNQNETRKKLINIRESLKTPPNKEFILNLGSRMYLDEEITPQKKFGAILEDYYDIEIVGMNSSNPSFTVEDANRWVGDVTRGYINNLISEGDLEDVVVLLLSTVYFRGTWVNQFLKNNTKREPFYLNSSRSISVPLMKIENKFLFRNSKSLDAKILRLPYKGNKLSMVIVLPNSIMGLSDLVKELNPSRLTKETNIMDEVKVKVAIPKFNYDFSAELVDALKALGITEIFDNTASLPGLARGASLKKKISVSNILQKSGIEINEIGSTAYSTTEVSLVNKFGEDEEDVEEFIVNKPFIFYIEHEETKQILFIGKVDDPTLGNNKVVTSSNTKPSKPPASPVVEPTRKPSKPSSGR